MCGIAGIYSLTGNYNFKGILPDMLSSMQHRGPDFSGQYYNSGIALGHNRLTIIDLSPESNQPFRYNHLVITYNGEVYNYVELRKELEKLNYQFRTKSDTEVICAAYMEWGRNCVRRFVGMWAFAIWDEKNKNLFCSRDRFGIKPFLYINKGTNFCFASEVNALKLCPGYSRNFNYSQLYRGLQMGWINYEENTYYSDIKNLPPACNLMMSNGNIIIERYWDIDDLTLIEENWGNKVEKFRNLFMDALRLCNRSDVPVGICLSGGLDSSAIAGGLSVVNQYKEIKSFTAFYSGFKESVDERPFVKMIVNKYKNIQPFYISPTEQEVGEAFDEIVRKFSVPFNGSSLISHYFVMKLVQREKIKVTIDGQGADEVFCGYMHSFYRLIGDEISKFKIFKGIRLLHDSQKYYSYSLGKTADVFLKSMLAAAFDEDRLYQLEFRHNHNILKKVNPRFLFSLKKIPSNKLNNFSYHLLFHSSLPSILNCVDFNSMAFSVESRVPFLDHRLVEYGFKLPNEDKINRSRTKYILRESLRDLLPGEIAERRDKRGFVTPGEVKWLRGPLRYLLNDSFDGLEMLNRKKVKLILERFQKGDNSVANITWRLAVLNYWVKHCLQ